MIFSRLKYVRFGFFGGFGLRFSVNGETWDLHFNERRNVDGKLVLFFIVRKLTR